MNTLSNATVAKKFNVSRATITRWLEQATNQKNNLQFTEENGKFLLLDNIHNDAEFKRLVEDGKKYTKQSLRKITNLDPNFQNIFSEEEVIEIMNDLKFKKQFKTKYSYKIPTFWDRYYLEFESPLKVSTSEMMSQILVDIMYLLQSPEHINVIDIGPGNGFPVKNLLTELDHLGLLNRYVAVDISEEMNTVATNNLSKWLPELDIKSYVRDIESAKFGKIFLENKSLSSNCSNLILHLGNTICNQDDRVQVFKNLKSGMVDNDLLIFTFTLDKDINRSQLNYIKASSGDAMQDWPLELFGIDIDKCTLETVFDSEKNCKSKSLILDKDYLVEFDLFGKKELLELSRNEKINIWRHYLISIEDLIEELEISELEMVNMKMDKTFSYATAICRVSTS